MPKFTFDMQLAASITVDAPDAETGGKWLKDVLNCADTNFGAYPNGDPVLGEVSLVEDSNLVMIDGDDVEDVSHVIVTGQMDLTDKGAAKVEPTPAGLAGYLAGHLEEDASFKFVDWNDLGEVTIQTEDGRTLRAVIIVEDITDEDNG